MSDYPNDPLPPGPVLECEIDGYVPRSEKDILRDGAECPFCGEHGFLCDVTLCEANSPPECRDDSHDFLINMHVTPRR